LVDGDDPNVTWHQADLLDADQIARLLKAAQPQALLHLAWYVAPGDWYGAYENFLWMQSSLELLRQFELLGGARVLMVGSGAEYDWRYGYCTEDRTPLDPNTYYGHCKLMLGNALFEFSKLRELNSTWARIFFLYGPGEAETRLVAHTINSILAGVRPRCTHGNQVRDYLHVADAADGLVSVLDSDHTGTVNIASGEPVTLRQLIGRVASQLEQPPDFIEFGAVEAPPTDMPFVVANVERLNVTGWRRTFDHDSGIAHTIDWWKQRTRV
jgi:nucleoside-diphosphate-sugar epimerase